MPVAPLERYTGNSIAEQVGVVRLQDDATALTRNLIQGTSALTNVADTMAKHAEAEYIANFDLDQRKKETELRVKHQLDPEGFQKEWQAHTTGTMAAVPLAFQKRAALSLKASGERGYEGVFLATAANTKKNADQSWHMEERQKAGDYLSIQAGLQEGKYTEKDAEAAMRAYHLHQEDGVRLGIIDEKGSALLRNDLVVRSIAQAKGKEARKRFDDELARPAPDAPQGPTKAGAPPAIDAPWRSEASRGLTDPGRVALDKRLGEDQDYADAVARGDTEKAGQLFRKHAMDVSKQKEFQASSPREAFVPAEIITPPGQKRVAPAVADLPDVRARKAAIKVLDEFDTDPIFSSIREPVTVATVRAHVHTEIRDAIADYHRARELNNEGLKNVEARLTAGLDIDVTEAQARAATALKYGDRKGAATWGMVATKGQALAEFGRMSLTDQATDLQATRARAQANPHDDAALFEYQIKSRVAERAQAGMKSDSFTFARNAYGRDQPPAQNIDFTKPDVAELKSRAAMVSVLEGRAGAQVSPFSAEEMSRFASTMKAAGAQDKQHILAALNDGLGPHIAARVMGTLSKDGHVDNATVYAAGLAQRGETAIAREIMAGLDELHDEKKAPKLPNFDKAVNDYVGGAFGRGDGATRAIDGARKAITARLAIWARDNGKVGEEVPSEIQEQYVKSTLGNIVRHNGAKIFPPRRDMGQREFDTTLFGIQDQDAPPLRGRDGTAKGITEWLKAGQLENIGDGKYVIRIGENQYATANPATMRPFILDRAFFDRVSTRIGYEDFGAFTSGNVAKSRPNSRPGQPWRPDAAPAPDWMRE